ncbi:PREDICTED: (DUF1262) [Prunus dulcis]|uniref:PREDICTED: (DUF1262) n=1 Tax=Prunus dulcis TaxID=3755 RepID=A0A5E4ETI9_PRUDU|nr:uncharacterized protein LOC117623478 [Prunus dulcis]KAI5340634.1 hypothetical protein L3X38_019908 [Prunus dulcis]VVA19087.1 PREDICTED: (DUF1262) [Prunus dulcis]
MYVTRPLSMYRKSPSTLSIKPPDAPHSGYVVITDEEAESKNTSCWGLCKRGKVKKLPFPQDKILTIVYTSEYQEATATKVWFIPVLDQPLSSNCYYVIRANGRHKGKACRCSRERDMTNCCIRGFLRDKKPKVLNFRDIYQQVKIHRHQGGGFFAESVAPDGVPPKFLKKKGWKVRSSSMYRNQLTDALGLDASLRSRLPDFNFPIFRKCSASSVVGRWYCPFAFVREKATIRHQMKKSKFYRITLEQWWEEIYSRGNVNNEGNVVNVSVDVQREVALVSATEAVKDDRNGRTGFTWFKAYNPRCKKVVSVGLSSAIVQNMRWVLEAGGWVNGDEMDVRVERVEEITGENRWTKFGCYVMVESFSLRRMDGSLAWRSDFRHTDKIRCKWE